MASTTTLELTGTQLVTSLYKHSIVEIDDTIICNTKTTTNTDKNYRFVGFLEQPPQFLQRHVLQVYNRPSNTGKH